jgi:hypothetical protein
MAVVNYWSHVPHIRTSSEVLDFGPGKLWQVPFEVWNHLTARAFEDHERAYVATQPVFFYIEAEVDWPFLVAGTPPDDSARIEVKESNSLGDSLFDELGFGFLTHFVESLGWNVAAALTIAAPTVAPGSLRTSMTLFAPDPPHFISLGSNVGVSARIQGYADHEWLLMPESAGEPLDDVTVAFASGLYDFVAAARQSPDLAAPLHALLDSAGPTLGSRERLVVATIALEALLMPEARTDLAATFCARLTNVLGGDPAVTALARTLYDARSAALHGDEPREAARVRECATRSIAQQLLAAAVLSVGPAILEGREIEEIRSGLEGGEAPANGIATPHQFPLPDPPAPAPSRLEHTTPSSVTAVFAPGGVMHADEGQYLSWSPLIGLGAAAPVVAPPLGFFVDSLSVEELMEMEERDIRRDFVAQLRGECPLHSVIGLHGSGHFDLDELRHRRHDAVTALRLAGFWTFKDPSLLGWYVYEETIRTRIPTVLRQSVLLGLAREPAQQITDGDLLDEMAALVARYRTEFAGPAVDGIITDFLSAHPNTFVPGETITTVLMAVVESVLGRFRPVADAVQLEDLVAAVADAESGSWFSAEGRAFRNSVAHGRWSAQRRVDQIDDEIRYLVSIATAAVRELLLFVTSQPDPMSDPTAELVRHLREQVLDG